METYAMQQQPYPFQQATELMYSPIYPQITPNQSINPYYQTEVVSNKPVVVLPHINPDVVGPEKQTQHTDMIAVLLYIFGFFCFGLWILCFLLFYKSSSKRARLFARLSFTTLFVISLILVCVVCFLITFM
ncbi:hypothetical protein EIN_154900 [Entamoeba invadens IP1]|uniref:Transmembrane protein n=1 Tax=Entamoeba invadens IP1 TaxID=370355 RepID=A0A0A1UCM2_ENTIV|nr:hypothetical protein EIN_154900 [Entamoeba invadens IP1]ELP91403.1 hypothetical protein EIN_154900 [Entamoeba invadens IP1]|eukprot:XP_004258174.1 hypothetical protein EIN_154900 [Entamoeba invadens IP1]